MSPSASKDQIKWRKGDINNDSKKEEKNYIWSLPCAQPTNWWRVQVRESDGDSGHWSLGSPATPRPPTNPHQSSDIPPRSPKTSQASSSPRPFLRSESYERALEPEVTFWRCCGWWLCIMNTTRWIDATTFTFTFKHLKGVLDHLLLDWTNLK